MQGASNGLRSNVVEVNLDVNPQIEDFCTLFMHYLVRVIL